MSRYSFRNDYSESAHEQILASLVQSNLLQEDGYGEDYFSREAKKMILHKMGNPQSDIHFLSGGTQTNLVVISSILRPYESVIAPATGHIAVHECGAIEATGHKIHTVDTHDGKLTAELIQPILDTHQDEHMVKPRLVFISDSTEVGTLYTRQELQKLSDFCRTKNLYLYLDGARLGSALTSHTNDISLSELAHLVDIFYIGGTKNGALLGEAVVINNSHLREDFRYHLKQKGALLAKSRVLGIQFLELFRENLFFELGEHANHMAQKLADGIKKGGYAFLTEAVSNQIFPILPNALIEKLAEKYSFYVWEKIDAEHSAIRLVTSWATQEDAVRSFLSDM